MSLNQVKLNPALVSQLYQSVLVEPIRHPAADKTLPKNDTQAKWKVLGGHKKKICILVLETSAVFLKDEQLAYLTRILQACKLTLEDVALLNLQGRNQFSYQLIQEQYPSSTCIVFGLTPHLLELPVDFPSFQLQNIEGCTYLFAPALDQLEPSKNDREKLWQALRKHFQVG